MPIRAASSPKAGREIVHEALAYRAFHLGTSSRAVLTGTPLPVYVAGPLRKGDSNSLARRIGWDYPLVNGHYLIGLARLRRKGRGFVFAGVTRGWFAERLMLAALEAEQKLAKEDEAIEPRLLKVPSAGIAALWLHGNNTDRYVVLSNQLPHDGAPLAIQARTEFHRRLRQGRSERPSR